MLDLSVEPVLLYGGGLETVGSQESLATSLAKSVSFCFNERPYLKTSRQKMVEDDSLCPSQVCSRKCTHYTHVHAAHTCTAYHTHTNTYAHTHMHTHASKSGFNSVPMFMCYCIPLFSALETS